MSVRRLLPLLVPLALSAAPLAAQTSPVVADLLDDVEDVESKLVGLARAFPEASYGWRPADGIRSVGEALKHVAADNYLIPAALGYTAPASTGIDGSDYGTAGAYEARERSKEEIVAELEASFAHLKDTMRQADAKGIEQETTLFGGTTTVRRMLIMATTHLHEHLGQAIAYARSNGVVPPWSR